MNLLDKLKPYCHPPRWFMTLVHLAGAAMSATGMLLYFGAGFREMGRIWMFMLICWLGTLVLRFIQKKW